MTLGQDTVEGTVGKQPCPRDSVTAIGSHGETRAGSSVFQRACFWPGLWALSLPRSLTSKAERRFRVLTPRALCWQRCKKSRTWGPGSPGLITWRVCFFFRGPSLFHVKVGGVPHNCA